MSELAPPGISGDLQTVFHYDPPSSQRDDERLRDQEERDFDVHAVLMRDSGFERDIKTELGPADGTSFFQVPPGVTRLLIENSSGKFAFVFNEKREYSGIQARCRARSAGEARAIVLRAVGPVIGHLAYFANAPLIVGNILCVDRKNNVSVVGYTSPYRTLLVSPGHMSFPVELLPVYALYREAKNATSHFYRFLCYYKILEGIYSTLRKPLFESARKLGISIATKKEVVPEHRELRMFQPQLIGRPIKDYVDRDLQDVRNSVAHYILDSGAFMNPSDPDAIAQVANAILPAELCCRIVIENQEDYLQQLGKAAQQGVAADRAAPGR
jgi:hypothetical protein